jgi:hypothetical protein
MKNKNLIAGLVMSTGTILMCAMDIVTKIFWINGGLSVLIIMITWAIYNRILDGKW